MKRNKNNISGTGRIKAPKYKRPHYEDVEFYTHLIVKYLEKQYANETIYMSYVDLAINKYNLKDNPECFKIKQQLQWYVESHNNALFALNIKKGIEQREKNKPLDEKKFSWDNITFCDGEIEIRDEDLIMVASYSIETSKRVFNDIKSYFLSKFPDLEVKVIGGKVVFNDEQRFQALLSSIDTNSKSSVMPDYTLIPKGIVYRNLCGASNAQIRSFILNLKQIFLSYLCTIHLDQFQIKYTTELRINFDNDFVENAFLFTVSESSNRILVVYENTEYARSSIVFFVKPAEYDNAINSICGFFSSRKLNKRETLAGYYVNFKQTGIISFRRVYHSDFNKWKSTINSFIARK